MDDAEIRARLDEVAHALRPLHKALVELVRIDYEKREGKSRSAARCSSFSC